jgi:hypothetical protein
MNDLFKFIGDQEEGLGYKYNRVYMLELMGRGEYMNVLITAPIRCEYATWNEFLKNWERV